MDPGLDAETRLVISTLDEIETACERASRQVLALRPYVDLGDVAASLDALWRSTVFANTLARLRVNEARLDWLRSVGLGPA